MWYEYYDHTPITEWDIAGQSKKSVNVFFPQGEFPLVDKNGHEKRHEIRNENSKKL